MKNLQVASTLAVAGWWLGVLAAPAQTLIVVQPTNHIVSPRLTDIHGGSADLTHGPTVIHHPPSPQGGGNGPDTALQTQGAPLVNATTGTNFDGINIYSAGYIPPDTNIAVGPNHIMETVNAAYAIYNKNGVLILGPKSLRSLWAGLGGACAANNGGDTVVQYDKMADRWMMTQLGSLSSPYAECIAISQTADPTGAYNLYSYAFGSNLNDYPKFGVWPTATNSAYLASYNLFANGSTFAGAEICAYDRMGMIAGVASPAGLCYVLGSASYLPADLDGATPPLDGTPGYFVNLSGSGLGGYAIKPDFSNSTATLTAMQGMTAAGYTRACGGGTCIPQPGTTRLLDSLGDRLMYRLAFRMFPDHEAMVVNHSVAAGSATGVRWYEMRAPVSNSGSFSLYQQGTFAPADSNYRWMGSAAMDQAGDIAIGYSVSSGATSPAIRYTGRAPGDTLGTMQSEATLQPGAGSQTGYTRWGDYSSLRIDPSDDCTFWYATEYYPISSSYGWYTRIGSFIFGNCGAAPTPDFSLSASPSSLTLNQGQQGTSTVTVTAINGFSSSVSLVPTCPASFTTCTVSPASTGPGNSTLTVTPAPTTTPGTYTVTVTGTSSSLTHTTTVSVTVNGTAADFTLSTSAPSLTISRGSSGSVTVNTTALGGSSSVTLSISGLPTKTSASFTANPVSAGVNSILKISANRPASPGTYNLTITGKNGTFMHTTPLTLTVQ